MGYLKNTINVQHAVSPLINNGYGPTQQAPIVDQTTKSIEFEIISTVPADRKLFLAPVSGVPGTLQQLGLKEGMVIINANGFARVIETVADDYIIVNASGNFFGAQKIFAYAAKTDGVLIYVGNTQGTSIAQLEVETAGGEVVTIKVPDVKVAGAFITPVQCVRLLSFSNVTTSDILYLF